MNRTAPLTALALAVALALGGCGAGPEETGGTAGTEAATGPAPAGTTSAAAGATGAAGTAAEISAEHNDADVMFARMMIPHHEQAVRMSEILLAAEDVPAEVRELAEGVIAAQGPEIQRMNQMLTTWGEDPVPAGSEEMAGMDHGSGAEGMMSEEDLQMLEDAQGAEAARRYLEQMTVHHEGAIGMARDEVADGRNPEAVELAEDVVAAQQAEIEEMAGMLRELRTS